MLHNIHQMLKDGRDAEAGQQVKQFLENDMKVKIRDLQFHQDNYSLNSVRGFIELEPQESAETSLFFKFHQEEGEESTVSEYYRAHLLHDNGFPVDLPVHVSTTPGAQIVLYHRRDWTRLSDASREVEAHGCIAEEMRPLILAEAELNRICDAIYRRTLHKVTAEQVANEPVLQLFIWRLVEDGSLSHPGGRVRRFYENNTFEFSGLERKLGYAELAGLKWEINGVRYSRTLGESFSESRRFLTPEHLALSAGLSGHGDAHNANVWCAPGDNGMELIYYDPAFAGDNIPALLSEIKTVFHNIFAHPDWLYHPEDADWLQIEARQENGWLKITHNWQLTPLRNAFLQSKVDLVIVPLLKECARVGMLQSDWRQIMRLALFCCPTLVMNLTPNATFHTPRTGLLGFALAIMLAGEPEDGSRDVVTDFLDRIEVAISTA